MLRRILLAAVIVLSMNTSHLCTLAAETSNDPNRPIKDKWAVIIGISQFANSSVPTLKYPAKDAEDFCNFLVNNGNFKKDHVLLLTNEKATREQIVDAFGDGWLPRRVMEDDLVVVFISSHGSPADRAGDNFIIAYDSNPSRPYSTAIRLQDLAAEVTKRTGCDRLVLLLDACHSGAAADGQKGLSRTLSNFDVNAIAGTGQLVISSSKPDQVSWESKRYPNGVFTHNLIDSLQLNGHQTKIDEAYKHLKEKVETEVRFDRIASQTPMMLSKWTGTELALCAPASEPRTLPFSDAVDPAAEISTAITSTVPLKVLQSPANQEMTNPKVSTSNVGNKPEAKNPITLSASQAGTVASSPYLLSSPMMSTSWTNNGGDVTLEKGTRPIQEAELNTLTRKQLELLLNETYARHGRGFYTRDIQEYFNKQKWYKIDLDYHWKKDDPKVISRGQTDDALVINQKRTPLQWSNVMLIKTVMQSR